MNEAGVAGGLAPRAWVMVALLCLLATLSYLDRYIIALLAAPIMKEMSLSGTQIGLLIGIGFGLLYAMTSVPMAHWLDNGHRVRIVSGGVALWSASTIASALAPDYQTMMVTRAGVAIGEALLVPAAVSLVADLFPAARRAWPIGLFMTVSTLMGPGSFLVGGLVLRVAERLGTLGGLAPWRMVLAAIGLFGLGCAPLWLALAREPERTASASEAVKASLGQTVAYVVSRRAVLAPFYLSFVVSAIGSYGFITWTTTMLQRSHGLSVPTSGETFGAIGLVFGGTGAFFWAAQGGRLIAAQRRGAAIALLAAALGLGNLAVATILATSSLLATQLALGAASFGFAAGAALAVLIIQSLAPAAMRARMTSFYMLAGNAGGLTLGPPLVPWLAENVFTGVNAMRTALGLIALVIGLTTAAMLLWSARKANAETHLQLD